MHRHLNVYLQIEGKNSPVKKHQNMPPVFNEHKITLISCCIWLIELWSKTETFNPCSLPAHLDTPQGRAFSSLVHRGKCSCHQDVNPGQGNLAFNSLLNPSKAPGRLLSASFITLLKPTEKKISLLSSRAVAMINVFKVTSSFVIDIPYSDFWQIC